MQKEMTWSFGVEECGNCSPLWATGAAAAIFAFDNRNQYERCLQFQRKDESSDFSQLRGSQHFRSDGFDVGGKFTEFHAISLFYIVWYCLF